MNVFTGNNGDVYSEIDEIHQTKNNNIIRIKLKTETEEIKDKYSVSNSLPILSGSLLSKESCHSKIKYARIRGGYIPKCFEIHRIPTIDNNQEIFNENFNKFDTISKSEGFDSYSSSSEIFLSKTKRYSENCICTLEERRIKEKVDEIVNKIMKKKKNGNSLKKK